MSSRPPRIALLLWMVLAAGCDRMGTAATQPDPARIQQLIEEAQAESATQRAATIPEKALPDRIKGYPDWNLQQTAADALGRIGAPAVPQLVDQLLQGDAERRQRAAEVLSRIGPAATDAIPYLIQALQDSESPLVRKAAARALGQIGPAAAAAVPELMGLLNESSSPAPSSTKP